MRRARARGGAETRRPLSPSPGRPPRRGALNGRGLIYNPTQERLGVGQRSGQNSRRASGIGRRPHVPPEPAGLLAMTCDGWRGARGPLYYGGGGTLDKYIGSYGLIPLKGDKSSKA